MIERRLGRDGPLVGAIALGCMGLSEFYEPVPESEAIATIHRALELGMTLIDTSDMYGRGENERLVGRALRGRREGAVLATKGGFLRRDDDLAWRGINGRPAYLKAACDASLARLGVEFVDLYYLHRVDPDVPIEESVGAMAELASAGKIRRIGLSQVDAPTLSRAAAVASITALQSEYSLFTRDVERSGVLEAARALGVTFVAYAPLGRGMLTRATPPRDELAEGDLRRRIPRFDEANVAHNMQLVDSLASIARERNVTPAQLALAWVVDRADDVVALPGCQRVAHAEENAAAAEIRLDAGARASLDLLFAAGAVAGERIR
ncbi:MAG: Aldo/keto reductase [Candidatus Eremiobacteraeota bacterium]|nr:Aldo/keto reductase [Candidatus Eremiobacteraeota bacterium]